MKTTNRKSWSSNLVQIVVGIGKSESEKSREDESSRIGFWVLQGILQNSFHKKYSVWATVTDGFTDIGLGFQLIFFEIYQFFMKF